jgi:hypothetical protein
MKIKKSEKIIIMILTSLMIISILIITIIIFGFKPFTNSPTGQVTKETQTDDNGLYEERDNFTGKSCFFNVGNKTISMYSCVDKRDCKDNIDRLRNDLKNFEFYVDKISVINCLGV